MVSALWHACSEGNLENVNDLLKETSYAEIETKDQNGVTPLIEAVKNGHVEVVKALLDKGVRDPTNASSEGLPDKGYYPPPPGAYYYPGMPIGAPMMPDGSVAYYPPPPSDQNPGGMGNLPPPEVARMIPCRYYPACRYGSSCMFAHPQAPYLQGPLPPPAQYPAHYDPMAPPPYPPPTYYAVPPPSFPTSPNGAPMNVMSPPPGGHPAPPPMSHSRSASEVVSPVQAPFSPNGVPPPMPYGVPPMSPTYGHPGQVPIPVSIPPLPPLNGGPQSPQQQQGMYPPMSPTAQGAMSAYPVQRDAPGPYAPQGRLFNGSVVDRLGSHSSSSAPQADGYGPGPGPMHRDGMSHYRRGGARRPSFGGPGRKPPCLFFPVGRCRNGDDCRFPHVMPENQLPYHPAHHPPHFGGRGGHRSRPSIPVNGDKFSAMTVQDQQQQPDGQPNHVRSGTNETTATSTSSRSQSSDPGSRRGPPGYRPNHVPNGVRPDKRPMLSKPQRVPNADEFPVLTSITPPLRSPALYGPNGNGWVGPTAAQILQAPPPRKDGQVSVRGTTPEQSVTRPSSKDGKPEVNGTQPEPTSKLPVSFAAAATAAPDAAKEVAVTA
ncbi:uncharacterized protein B0H18DRAFT_1081474 [Fomitopsis serialis]|uniref:uncharacterized protein n=1 Tax=Fomitopsis serialis TaxID=139415 RepID=UPI00200766DD|nr:uncharacterized protein B0H18DRAFT_1081474 [Neoantrodia serialis]KAH9937223.1 hypothetical protein B0H18DRAFT_1081474 [Neoantrodia serialis]